MTIEESKNLLKTKGYTSFNLKDFNEEYYNKLLPFKCNESNNLKKYMKGIRADANGLNLYKDCNSFEEAEVEKNKAIENYFKNNDALLEGFGQIYYQYHFNSIFQDVTGENLPDSGQNYYKNIIDSIVKYFFDLDESVRLNNLTNATYYDTECVLAKHSDGTGTGRICAVLTYLNDTYNTNDGGLLILDEEHTVLPLFGNIAIIDLQTFDIIHEVTKVVGGLGRFAILSFMKIHDDSVK
jgi:Rps23 Pro-64 3,4-dihydroxylase Tpa1-like proline 4-hydroxylase